MAITDSAVNHANNSAASDPVTRDPLTRVPAPARPASPGLKDPRTLVRGRLAGLDGLRAIAVVAVVLFHLDSTLLPGGFLGVDVFFVVSGFLITRLLVGEVAEAGSLRLGRFYLRRVRRLFPAVGLLLLAVAAAGTWVWRDEASTLRAGVISSLTYVTNWWLIFGHQSYFVASGRPSMLQHLWSLAIEEQYYLVWAAVVGLLSGALRVRHRAKAGRSAPSQRIREGRFRLIALVAFVLALSSTLAMAVIAILTDVPYGADSSRVYFGTDTHGMGLLLGSAAGAWSMLRPRPERIAKRRVPAWVTDLITAAALVLLLQEFRHLNEYSPGLFRGAFLLLDALALIAVCGVVRQGSRLGPWLDHQPLRWIGQRSYAIYLWHWPVIVVTRPGVDVHGSVLLIDLARLGLILALAEASYRFVEYPIRSGNWRVFHGRPRGATSGRFLAGALAGFCCLVVLLSAALPTASPAGAETAAPLSTPPVNVPQTPTRTPVPTPSLKSPPRTLPTSPPGARRATSPAARPPLPAISGFGDSVLLGATRALDAADTGVAVHAFEGRQAYLVLDAIAAAQRRGQLSPTVLIHTGNNGLIKPSQLASTLALLKDRRRVLLITDHVPRDWQAPNDQTMTSVAAQFQNVRLVDWGSLAAGHPGWFYRDGLHVNATGAAAYAQLILSAAR